MGPIIIIRIDVDIVDDYNNYDDDPPVRISYRCQNKLILLQKQFDTKNNEALTCTNGQVQIDGFEIIHHFVVY